jgi:ADP-dependent NAD(P)H-hydrate dehydratase / NAD(P)H-hydrate epimerase
LQSQNALMHLSGRLHAIDSAIPLQALHGTQASRDVERVALAAQSSDQSIHQANDPAPNQGKQPSLMERAGLAVARLALAIAPHAQRVLVFAGPGNNGGDGLVAARHLHQQGKAVSVLLLADTNKLPADADLALRDALAAGVQVRSTVRAVAHDLAIDALLGLGVTRAPTGAIAQAIGLMNASGAPVLAVDLPSGLCADTGIGFGDAVVRATATLCLLTLKPGCFTGHGRDLAGRVWLDTLGCGHERGPEQEASPPTAWLTGRPPRSARPHASHKGSFGDVAVVGGAPGMAGAAWLAARAALAVGAGRVYCSLLDDSAPNSPPPFNPLQPELMGRRAWWLSSSATLESTTVVCGCGGGDVVRTALPALLTHAGRLVLDADALNAIATDAALQNLLRQRADKGLATVLTPHPLEAARLLQCNTSQVQNNRLRTAQSLADQFKLTVVLKGSGTVVATWGELPRINSSGNAALASAGTGDVLAGCVGGWWAQNPQSQAAAVTAMASAAVWWHGWAADQWLAAGHQGPLRASDLVRRLATNG